MRRQIETWEIEYKVFNDGEKVRLVYPTHRLPPGIYTVERFFRPCISAGESYGVVWLVEAPKAAFNAEGLEEV